MVSSTFKSSKSQPRTASWNYSGSVRVGSGRFGSVRVGSGQFGSGRFGSVRVGPIVILRLTQSSCAGAGTELGNDKVIK